MSSGCSGKCGGACSPPGSGGPASPRGCKDCEDEDKYAGVSYTSVPMYQEPEDVLREFAGFCLGDSVEIVNSKEAGEVVRLRRSKYESIGVKLDGGAEGTIVWFPPQVLRRDEG